MRANLPFIKQICCNNRGRFFQSELDTEFLSENRKSFRSIMRGRGQGLMLVHDQKIVIRHSALPALKITPAPIYRGRPENEAGLRQGGAPASQNPSIFGLNSLFQIS